MPFHGNPIDIRLIKSPASAVNPKGIHKFKNQNIWISKSIFLFYIYLKCVRIVWFMNGNFGHTRSFLIGI